MRIVLPLLLVAVVVTGCAAQSTPAQSSPARATSAGAPATSNGSPVKDGAPIDACKYLTQADAESMLGVATGPGKHESATKVDATCAYVPTTGSAPGTRVALTVSTGEFSGSGTLAEFKSEWPDARDVGGLGYPAMRNGDGSNFAMQGNGRGCGLIMSVKKPADPDAFARQVGAACAKGLAG
jgi:hypothetical protein